MIYQHDINLFSSSQHYIQLPFLLSKWLVQLLPNITKSSKPTQWLVGVSLREKSLIHENHRTFGAVWGGHRQRSSRVRPSHVVASLPGARGWLRRGIGTLGGRGSFRFQGHWGWYFVFVCFVFAVVLPCFVLCLCLFGAFLLFGFVCLCFVYVFVLCLCVFCLVCFLCCVCFVLLLLGGCFVVGIVWFCSEFIHVFGFISWLWIQSTGNSKDFLKANFWAPKQETRVPRPPSMVWAWQDRRKVSRFIQKALYLKLQRLRQKADTSRQATNRTFQLPSFEWPCIARVFSSAHVMWVICFLYL